MGPFQHIATLQATVGIGSPCVHHTIARGRLQWASYITLLYSRGLGGGGQWNTAMLLSWAAGSGSCRTLMHFGRQCALGLFQYTNTLQGAVGSGHYCALLCADVGSRQSNSRCMLLH